MSFLDKHRVDVDAVKRLKESWASKHPDAPNSPSVIYGYRGDDPVSAILIMGDEDDWKTALGHTAIGFSCDVVITGFESYSTAMPENPFTGKSWTEGDLAVISSQFPDSPEAKQIIENLTVLIYDREGNWVNVCHTYHMEDNKVIWDDQVVIESTDENQADGPEMRMMATLMKIPKAMSVLTGYMTQFDHLNKPDNPALVMEVLQDMTTAAILQTELKGPCAVTLSADEGSERAMFIDKYTPTAKAIIQDKLQRRLEVQTLDGETHG